jgi:hypothetical protein
MKLGIPIFYGDKEFLSKPLDRDSRFLRLLLKRPLKKPINCGKDFRQLGDVQEKRSG